MTPRYIDPNLVDWSMPFEDIRDQHLVLDPRGPRYEWEEPDRVYTREEIAQMEANGIEDANDIPDRYKVLLTKDVARFYLNKNFNNKNRKLRTSAITYYAKLMREGLWIPYHPEGAAVVSCILTKKESRLSDISQWVYQHEGVWCYDSAKQLQHRCHAALNSKVTKYYYIYLNRYRLLKFDEELTKTLDDHGRRNLTDRFWEAGYNHITNDLKDLITAIHRGPYTKRPDISSDHRVVVPFYTENREKIDEFIKVTDGLLANSSFNPEKELSEDSKYRIVYFKGDIKKGTIEKPEKIILNGTVTYVKALLAFHSSILAALARAFLSEVCTINEIHRFVHDVYKGLIESPSGTTYSFQNGKREQNMGPNIVRTLFKWGLTWKAPQVSANKPHPSTEMGVKYYIAEEAFSYFLLNKKWEISGSKKQHVPDILAYQYRTAATRKDLPACRFPLPSDIIFTQRKTS